MTDKKKIESTKHPTKIPKDVLTTIPFTRVYDDTNTDGGIIEISNGLYSKSYYLDDTSFSDLGDEEQDDILKSFERILNTFNHLYSYEITVNIRNIDKSKFNETILMQYKKDELDDLRAEHNEIILDKMQEGKNNLKAEKYITISVEGENIKDALELFASIEKEINVKFKHINNTGMRAISLKDRMKILHNIYNLENEDSFNQDFNPRSLQKQGMSIKTAIAPMSFDFKSKNMDFFKIGGIYGRSMILRSIPANISGNLIETLSSVSTNMLLSVHYDAQEQEKAVAFASHQVTSVGGDVIKQQTSLSRSGASPDMISPKLRTAQLDAQEMLDDLTNRNQKLFKVTVVATVFATNEKDLDMFTEQIKTKAKENVCSIGILYTTQEQGFNSSLPLAKNYLDDTYLVMTSETASAVQPFSTVELQSKGGFYYGLNTLSKNLIIYNRSIGINQNGFILGSPGTGKSFTAKIEMYQTYLNTDNTQIFVLDPEQEYTVLANRLGGQVFSIEPGGTTHLNPLDLDITKDSDGDPLAQKIDYIICIIERMLGGKSELSGYAKSFIDATLQDLYRPYIADLESRGVTIDTDTCPTLKDLYDMLSKRKEPEARNLAASIRTYCDGALDLFAHHTNIDVNAKMVTYDTSHIGTNLKELGMQICLNDIWNRMIANKKKKIRTYFYIDEAHLFLRMPSSAEYIAMVWKRARKWMGTPTFITQNVEDMLRSAEGNTILSTSDFAVMLSQSPLDRAALSELFHISPEQQEFFTHTGCGEGLIYTAKAIVPFENHFPENTELYKILSTKPADAEALA
jgi:hypothetical protein